MSTTRECRPARDLSETKVPRIAVSDHLIPSERLEPVDHAYFFLIEDNQTRGFGTMACALASSSWTLPTHPSSLPLTSPPSATVGWFASATGN
jgi:hypothetical protein